MKTRITQLTVAPEDADLYDPRSTVIEIVDEGGGEFVKIAQPSQGAEISVETAEWPAIRTAIDNMIEECVK